jgi:hypothetical protein
MAAGSSEALARAAPVLRGEMPSSPGRNEKRKKGKKEKEEVCLASEQDRFAEWTRCGAVESHYST